MIRVEVKPKLLRWACERAGFDIAEVAERIPQLTAWERGATKPTLKQIERFAKTVHAPVGYFFLPAAPVEHIPIPDFRTVGNEHIGHPSPDLWKPSTSASKGRSGIGTMRAPSEKPPLHSSGPSP